MSEISAEHKTTIQCQSAEIKQLLTRKPQQNVTVDPTMDLVNIENSMKETEAFQVKKSEGAKFVRDYPSSGTGHRRGAVGLRHQRAQRWVHDCPKLECCRALENFC